MKSHRLFLLLALVITSFITASAQTDRGSITGTVTDPTGAVVADAKVTATNLNSGEVRTANTSGEGTYTLPEMKADPWKLTFEAAGFSTATIEKVQVAVQIVRRADV
ncbi:MAG TPA: carboxypeptidase-like regulatory domain-containing protein, partial [Pyrinomonadaceae bacterium]|nr:carboxypeptidase-like regulatory domain-containing protein [Pyrinomonadaceae bacterium]